MVNGGIGTDEFKKELSDEKQSEQDKIEKKKEEEIKSIRDEYMSRIRGAKNPADKERLLTEMQARIKAAEDEAERLKKQQMKMLEKNLRARQRKRLQDKVKAKNAEIEDKLKSRELLDFAKELEKMKLYAEGEDLVPERLKETADHLVAKAAETELDFDHNDDDKEQMQVLDVKQQTELDKALKEVDFEIEEELEQEKEKLLADAESQIEAKRKALRDKLNATNNEDE